MPTVSTQAATSTSISTSSTHAVANERSEPVDHEMMILADSSDEESDHEMDIVDDEVDQDEVDQDQNEVNQDQDEVNQDQDEVNQDIDRELYEISDKRFKRLRFFAKSRFENMNKEEYPKTEQSFLLTIRCEIAQLRNYNVSNQRMELYIKGFKEVWLEAAKHIEEQGKKLELEKKS